MTRRQNVALAWLVGASVVVCACKSSDAPAPEPRAEASDGVRRACEHQKAWPLRIHAVCTNCVSLAAAPKCECRTDRKEYSGLCSLQQQAKLDDKPCDPVWQCTYKCKRTDCECIARCYEGKDHCHQLGAALESCVVKVCDPFCRGE